MKKIENTFAVTGFVGKDASIHEFTTSSVARFSLAISRTEKNGDETSRTSAVRQACFEAAKQAVAKVTEAW